MDISSVSSSSVITQVLGSSVSGAGSPAIPVSAQNAVVPAPVVTEEQAKNAVDTTNKVVQIINNGVEFSIDESTGINVVKVVDKVNGSVIRQLPIEEVIAFAKTLDSLQGLLFKQHA